MRRFGLSMLAVVGALGISLMAANEKPSDAMKAVMKANAAANTTARAAAEGEGLRHARQGCGHLQSEHGVHRRLSFTHKKLDAAATIAKSGLKACDGPRSAATAKDQAGVDEALTAVTGTCGGCHKQFREQLADKTYEIKLP